MFLLVFGYYNNCESKNNLIASIGINPPLTEGSFAEFSQITSKLRMHMYTLLSLNFLDSQQYSVKKRVTVVIKSCQQPPKSVFAVNFLLQLLEQAALLWRALHYRKKWFLMSLLISAWRSSPSKKWNVSSVRH